MASCDPIAAEALRLAGLLEERASQNRSEDDMRASTLLRVLLGKI
jgi:hypothetical protein